MSDDDLLDAAVEQLVLTGVRRTSADDIARRAGVNRATLYRRVGTMDAIVHAAYLRETGRVLARIEAAIGDVPPPGTATFDPAAYVHRMFTATLDEVRGNELLARLLLTDREQTLVGLTAGAADVIAVSAKLVAHRITALRAHVGNPRTDDVTAVSVALARLTQSLLLTPDNPPATRTAAGRRRFVESVVLPLVLGPQGAAPTA